MELLKKILFVISGTAMTTLVSARGDYSDRLIGIVLSAFIMMFLAFKKDILKKALDPVNEKFKVISFFVAIIFNQYNVQVFIKTFSKVFKEQRKLGNPSLTYQLEVNDAAMLLSLVALFAAYIFAIIIISYATKVIKAFYRSTNKVEVLLLVSSFIIMSIAVIYLYSKTDIFYQPTFEGKNIKYDVVYSLDGPGQLATNVFSTMSAFANDLRQPLFGLFSFPFGVIAIFLSKILFFIPYGYSLILAMFHIIVAGITIILISRLLKLNKVSTIMFYLTCFSSYSFILFTTNVEQYVFSVFWLVLFIYSYINDTENKDFLYIASTGNMLTSGILFPFITKYKTFKQYAYDIFQTAVKFFMITIVVGQFNIFLNFVDGIKFMMRFTGESVSFNDRIVQFSNFVESCFVKPDVTILTSKFPSYFLSEPGNINVVGCTIFLAIIVGFTLNYKDKFIQTCFIWSIFSIAILVILGWGSAENGMNLYSYYFVWAFIAILFKALEKLLKNRQAILRVVQGAIIIYLLSVNIPAMIELVQFGIKYYS